MPDDKSKRDIRDRDRVSGDEEYEVGYFASKFSWSVRPRHWAADDEVIRPRTGKQHCNNGSASPRRNILAILHVSVHADD
ncbi:MAG: DUF3606 domain-containing protein [Mesorhizobium sp.]|nr:MAG: DUF3606 domain-containing protein [Mesorhizobium sp.]